MMIQLSNEKLIPSIAYGTGTAWFNQGREPAGPGGPQNKQLIDCIKQALSLGFTHLDAAEMYGTESEGGAALSQYLAESGRTREELWVTSKVMKSLPDVAQGPSTFAGKAQARNGDRASGALNPGYTASLWRVSEEAGALHRGYTASLWRVSEEGGAPHPCGVFSEGAPHRGYTASLWRVFGGGHRIVGTPPACAAFSEGGAPHRGYTASLWRVFGGGHRIVGTPPACGAFSEGGAPHRGYTASLWRVFGGAPHRGYTASLWRVFPKRGGHRIVGTPPACGVFSEGGAPHRGYTASLWRVFGGGGTASWVHRQPVACFRRGGHRIVGTPPACGVFSEGGAPHRGYTASLWRVFGGGHRIVGTPPACGVFSEGGTASGGHRIVGTPPACGVFSEGGAPHRGYTASLWRVFGGGHRIVGTPPACGVFSEGGAPHRGYTASLWRVFGGGHRIVGTPPACGVFSEGGAPHRGYTASLWRVFGGGAPHRGYTASLWRVFGGGHRIVGTPPACGVFSEGGAPHRGYTASLWRVFGGGHRIVGTPPACGVFSEGGAPHRGYTASLWRVFGGGAPHRGYTASLWRVFGGGHRIVGTPPACGVFSEGGTASWVHRQPVACFRRGGHCIAVRASLQRLQTPYLDLYLIHAPFLPEGASLEGVWRQMEACVGEGLVRSIGVSNFRTSDLEELLTFARIRPVVNQVELHPYLQQPELSAFHKTHGVLTSSYGPLTPLVHAKGGPLDPLLNQLAKKYDKTPEQVLLRWNLQKGNMLVTTSSKPERMTQLLAVGSTDTSRFSLSEADMAEIDRVGATHPFRKFWAHKL
ncbi:MAG: hypothetical protein WDW36_009983 [Sanguina aurantia]